MKLFQETYKSVIVIGVMLCVSLGMDRLLEFAEEKLLKWDLED